MKRLICLVVLVTAFAAAMSTASATQGDSARGHGEDASGAEFHFRALSGPNGEDPSGSMSLRTSAFYVEGAVFCLVVTGNEATIIGRVTYREGLDSTYDLMTFAVGDNRGTGQPDTFAYAVEPETGQVCGAQGQFQAISRGNIGVRDN